MYFILYKFFYLLLLWYWNKLLIFLKLRKNLKTFGKSLRNILFDCGITFMKIGQILSNRNDLFDQDIIEELKLIQDNVKLTSICDFKRHDDLILNEVLASGTIAIVYKGVFKNNPVVIKVRRKNIKNIINKDFNNINKIFDLLYYLINLTSFLNFNVITNIYQPKILINEVKNLLLEQIDFKNEAMNQNKFYNLFKNNNYIVIPKIYLFEENFIIMEYFDGYRLDNKEILNKKYFEILLEFLIVSCLSFNICHGDLHMGNILLNKEDNKIVIIDFGIVFNFTNDQITCYFDLLMSIVFNNNLIFSNILINDFACNKKYCLENINEIQEQVKEKIIDINQNGKLDTLDILIFSVNILNKYKTKLKLPILRLFLSMIVAEGTINRLVSNKINLWGYIHGMLE